MENMKREQLNQFRERLLQLTDRAGRDAETVREQALGPGGSQAAGGLSDVPTHLGDLGTEAYLQELNSTLLENEEYLLGEAIAALRRIDEGTFGNCENCSQPIPEERLKAIPWTRYCTKCAQALNPGPSVNLNAGRPGRPSETLAGAGDRPLDTDAGAVDDEPDNVPQAGAAGGAVGGTPAGKRARGVRPSAARRPAHDVE
jgi:RNA polymerase-binding transcription factor DksA